MTAVHKETNGGRVAVGIAGCKSLIGGIKERKQSTPGRPKGGAEGREQGLMGYSGALIFAHPCCPGLILALLVKEVRKGFPLLQRRVNAGGVVGAGVEEHHRTRRGCPQIGAHLFEGEATRLCVKVGVVGVLEFALAQHLSKRMQRKGKWKGRKTKPRGQQCP